MWRSVVGGVRKCVGVSYTSLHTPSPFPTSSHTSYTSFYIFPHLTYTSPHFSSPTHTSKPFSPHLSLHFPNTPLPYTSPHPPHLPHTLPTPSPHSNTSPTPQHTSPTLAPTFQRTSLLFLTLSFKNCQLLTVQLYCTRMHSSHLLTEKCKLIAPAKVALTGHSACFFKGFGTDGPLPQPFPFKFDFDLRTFLFRFYFDFQNVFISFLKSFLF